MSNTLSRDAQQLDRDWYMQPKAKKKKLTEIEKLKRRLDILESEKTERPGQMGGTLHDEFKTPVGNALSLAELSDKMNKGPKNEGVKEGQTGFLYPALKEVLSNQIIAEVFNHISRITLKYSEKYMEGPERKERFRDYLKGQTEVDLEPQMKLIDTFIKKYQDKAKTVQQDYNYPVPRIIMTYTAIADGLKLVRSLYKHRLPEKRQGALLRVVRMAIEEALLYGTPASAERKAISQQAMVTSIQEAQISFKQQGTEDVRTVYLPTKKEIMAYVAAEVEKACKPQRAGRINEVKQEAEDLKSRGKLTRMIEETLKDIVVNKKIEYSRMQEMEEKYGINPDAKKLSAEQQQKWEAGRKAREQYAQSLIGKDRPNPKTIGRLSPPRTPTPQGREALGKGKNGR